MTAEGRHDILSSGPDFSISSETRSKNMAGKSAKRHRTPHKIGVGFLGAGTQFTGELVNVSISGLLVRCENTLPVGTMGRLGIEMEYGTIRTVVVMRRIVERVGLAFQFSHMTPRDRQTLQRLLLRLELATPPGSSPSGSPPRTTRR